VCGGPASIHNRHGQARAWIEVRRKNSICAREDGSVVGRVEYSQSVEVGQV
jgi:hypothetical protein